MIFIFWDFFYPTVPAYPMAWQGLVVVVCPGSGTGVTETLQARWYCLASKTIDTPKLKKKYALCGVTWKDIKNCPKIMGNAHQTG